KAQRDRRRLGTLPQYRHLVRLAQPGLRAAVVTGAGPLPPGGYTDPGGEGATMAKLWNDVTNRVMRLAEQEARRFQHEYIGTEHVLMALLRLHGCAATRALAARGIDLRHIRLEVEKIVQYGPERPRLPRVLPLTPRARQALRNAVEAADALGKVDVDTGHL